MENEEIVGKIKELIAPLLMGRQAELVELTHRSQGGRSILKVLVDTPRGITLEGLSRLNQAIGAILDEHDLFEQPYLLEVSSPGLDRSLKTPADFERVIGRRIRVMTFNPVQGRHEWVGELMNANEEAIVLQSDQGEKVRVLLTQITQATQEIEF